MSALRHLKPLSAFVKTSNAEKRTCESLPFKFTCYLTTTYLICCSILLGAHEFFGTPILCMSSLNKKVINNYCWVTSTFTIDDYSIREIGNKLKETGEGAAAPGVFTPEDFDDAAIQLKWTFHNYYQWVVFALFFAAGLSFFPKLIWIWCEGNVIPTLTKNLTQNIYKESDVVKRKKEVVKYFQSHLKLHNFYFFTYLFCELLCLVIVITKIWYFNKFLGGTFMEYGFKVIDFADTDQAERVDPMIFIFPRQTKCNFHLYGASGTLERRDAFCLLPQNILNEKIFIMLWFWLGILLITLVLLVFYRLAILFSSNLRFKILELHAKYVPKEVLETITARGSYGDWWIFYQLTSKIDPFIYKDILCNLARELETKPSNSREQLNSNGYMANCGAYNGHAHEQQRMPRQSYYPNVSPQLASAPPAGFAQSAV